MNVDKVEVTWVGGGSVCLCVCLCVHVYKRKGRTWFNGHSEAGEGKGDKINSSPFAESKRRPKQAIYFFSPPFHTSCYDFNFLIFYFFK